MIPTAERNLFKAISVGALDEAGVAHNTIVIFSSDNGPEERIEREDAKLMGPGYGRYYSVGSSGCLGAKSGDRSTP